MKNKHFFCAICLLMASMSASAIPALPGVWKTMLTASGDSVRVELTGDETLHYYRSANGECYRLNVDGRLEKFDALQASAKVRPRRISTRSLVPDDYVFPLPPEIFQGERRGLIILVNFSNNTFSMDNPRETYYNIANAPGYNEGKFCKSVRDYFLEQSEGQFDLSFDVVGPVQLANLMSYYGGNNDYGNDLRPGEMIKEACIAVDDSVDFTKYDWNGDGEVDQVFVVYAGYGEADGASVNTIWPHEWNLLDATGETITLDGMVINTYACGNELEGLRGQNLAGIGVICHEFSHCMGLPDLYDNYNFGMGAWDLMSNGARNGGGFNPIEYSAYEKMVCGWRQPIVLDSPTEIKGMKPVTDGGETYIIYCDNPAGTEYYLLENKDKDDLYPYNYTGKGLLVTHVDYDPELWYHNMPNTTATYYRIDGTKGYNTHQRLTIIAADNSTKARGGYITDVYPIDSTTSTTLEPNNALTTTTVPAATQYNGGDEPVPFAGCELTDINRNADGTINFRFRMSEVSGIDIVEDEVGKHVKWYDLSGKQIKGKPLNRGVYITKDAKGTSKKVCL